MRFFGVEREPALRGLRAEEMLLHWHGDTFDLPAGAVHLASTPICPNQAFRLRNRQFGLQFHCELGAETIAAWVRDDADYVRGANGDDGGERILADTERFIPEAGQVGDRLLRNIFATFASAAPAERSATRAIAALAIPASARIVGTQWRSSTSANQTFTLGLIQMRCSDDPAENRERALAKMREAAARGAQVICLPELFATQYFCQTEDHANFDLAEPIPGPTTAALAKVAAEKKVVIIGSLFERRAAGIYHNTAVVIDADGAMKGMYRKMHIPDDPLYYEKFYFTPGDLGFRAFDTAHGRIGTLVCWDQWYPEGARLTALAGADVLFYPTAIGWHPSEKARVRRGAGDAWRTIQRAHAIANGVYVAAVNRVGPREAGARRRGRHRVLGRLVRERSVRRRAGRGVAHRGRDPDRAVRSPRTRRPCAATGRSCAIAASTPIADHAPLHRSDRRTE